jgi:hypothetical protein
VAGVRNIQPGMGRFYACIWVIVAVAFLSGGRGVQLRPLDQARLGEQVAGHWAVGRVLIRVMMAAGLAEIPAAVVFKLMNDRRRTRPARGLCLRCGYDLRGTPGRCPECGDAVGAKVPLVPVP